MSHVVNAIWGMNGDHDERRCGPGPDELAAFSPATASPAIGLQPTNFVENYWPQGSDSR